MGNKQAQEAARDARIRAEEAEYREQNERNRQERQGQQGQQQRNRQARERMERLFANSRAATAAHEAATRMRQQESADMDEKIDEIRRGHNIVRQRGINNMAAYHRNAQGRLAENARKRGENAAARATAERRRLAANEVRIERQERQLARNDGEEYIARKCERHLQEPGVRGGRRVRRTRHSHTQRKRHTRK